MDFENTSYVPLESRKLQDQFGAPEWRTTANAHRVLTSLPLLLEHELLVRS
jgi:hypothetical protein